MANNFNDSNLTKHVNDSIQVRQLGRNSKHRIQQHIPCDDVHIYINNEMTFPKSFTTNVNNDTFIWKQKCPEYDVVSLEPRGTTPINVKVELMDIIADGATYRLQVLQDSHGGHTLTFLDNIIVNKSIAPLVQNTTPNSLSVYEFISAGRQILLKSVSVYENFKH
jgi:hypothetical protein